MNKRTVLIILVIIGLAAGGIVFFKKNPAENPEAVLQDKSKPPAMVQVIPASKKTISRIQELTGEVMATESVVLSAMTEGPVVFCPWREGDSVEAGEKLIEIDRGVTRAEVQTAEAALSLARAKLADMQSGTRPEEIVKAEEIIRQLTESSAFAKLDFERTAMLVESGALPGEALEKAKVEDVSQNTRLSSARKHLEMLKKGPTPTALDVEQAAVSVARANLALIRAKLAESVITAPFSGTITRANVRPGALAAAKTPLIEMINPASLVVRLAVPEVMASIIHLGMKLDVALDAYPGIPLSGKVVRIYPELDQRTRTLTAEARMDGTTVLLPGMFGRVKLYLESAEDTVVLPSKAVVTRPSAGKVVFIADAGKARMQPVTTGIETGSQIQIVTGVQPGDKVIVAGNEKLKDGSAIGLAGGDKSAKDKTGAAAGGDAQ